MEVTRMNKGEWGKIRAFFDIKTKEGFIMKGFKLIETDGLFVGFPSEKDKEGKYSDTVIADKQLKMEVNKLAHDYYNQDQNQQKQSFASSGL